MTQESVRSETLIFEDIFLKYFSKIRMFALKILKSETEAEDIVQDIFMKLWTQKDELQNIASIEAYLYRMTRNAIYNHIKHKYVERDYVEYMMQNNSSENNIYDNIYANELKDRIQKAISKMPPQRKKIFLLSRQKGLSNTEIAKQLHLTRSTVDNHIYLAVTDLKKVLLALFALFFNLH